MSFVLRSDPNLLADLIEHGQIEYGTRILIQKLLKPGDMYVDVGANIGMHTLAAARAMQGVGRIIAFEPFGRTKEMLEKTIWLNGFSRIAEIHEAAVSNVGGQRKLYISSASALNSLLPLEDTQRISVPSVDVCVVRLDGVIPPGNRIDLIKIDAEGAELEVLEGAEPFITGNPDIALIVEFGSITPPPCGLYHKAVDREFH